MPDGDPPYASLELFSTPDTPVGDSSCRRIELVGTDTWWSLLSGAISLMMYEGNWVKKGSATVEECVQVFSEMYTQFEESECVDPDMSVPLGTIIYSAHEGAPAGYLECNGAAYFRVDFPALYAILDDYFIVDADHFLVPSLVGRVALGMGTAIHVESYDMGDMGGEDFHTLTEDEIPAHVHEIAGMRAGVGTDVRMNGLATDFSNDTEATGGGLEHENRQPYQALRALIKAYDV